jgi:Uma2 family endonuclease
MASIADRLTIADFERRYGDSKPYHEFWFGEAVPKPMPTWLHGLLQKIIMVLLDAEGYTSASEVKLKISSDFEPVPDVIATRQPIELPYPTKPVDVVVEILSPDSSFQRIMRKCKLYSEWGIATVAVLDPESREGWVWDKGAHALIPITAIVLPNGLSIALERIFAELAANLQ